MLEVAPVLSLALWSRYSPSSLLLLPSSMIGGSGAPVGGRGNARMGAGISSRSITNNKALLHGGMLIRGLAGLGLVPVLGLTTSSSVMTNAPSQECIEESIKFF